MREESLLRRWGLEAGVARPTARMASIGVTRPSVRGTGLSSHRTIPLKAPSVATGRPCR